MRGKQIRIGWAKSSSLDSTILEQIRNGATRNLFVGNVPPGVSQEQLGLVFAPYGPIENLVVLRSKKIAFVNLSSIRAAVHARNVMNQDPGIVLQGMRLKLNFAKEKINPLLLTPYTSSSSQSSLTNGTEPSSLSVPSPLVISTQPQNQLLQSSKDTQTTNDLSQISFQSVLPI